MSHEAVIEYAVTNHMMAQHDRSAERNTFRPA